MVVLDEALILSVGVPKGSTLIVMLLLVATSGLGHASLDVISHVTTSLFTSELVVYVLLLVPALVPFTFHW
jgi:hypothetical protein